MKRCLNCGWENKAGVEICIKCRTPFPASPNNNKMKKTIRGAISNSDYIDQPNSKINKNKSTMIVCPNCHATNRAGVSNCVYCQFPLTEKKEKPSEPIKEKPKVATGTVPYWEEATSSAFQLVALDRTGKPSGEAVSFQEDQVELNRDNLSPGNKTITSKTQALISNENGQWYIENKSELKSTYIRLEDHQKIHLVEGMVVMFGNKRFVFKKD